MVKTKFDGMVLYNNAPPELAVLDGNVLVRHPLSDLPGLRGFTSDEEWATPKDGAHLYAGVGEDLFEVRRGRLIPFDTPDRWTPRDMPPSYFADVDGYFTTAGDRLWFRRQHAATWVPVAPVDAANGPLAISQTDRFGVEYDPASGDLHVLLRDSVLVGRLGPEDASPVFFYEFSGSGFVHPTGQVLATWKQRWKPDAIGQQLRGRKPPWNDVDFGLWLLRPTGPERADGPRVQPFFTAGKKELATFEYFFHRESEKTLIEHSTGIAAFDGTRLHGVPSAPEWHDNELRHVPGRFLRLGDRVLYVRPEGLWVLHSDLSFEPVALPEPLQRTTLISFDYSEALNRTIVAGGHDATGSKLSAAYATHDFTSYENVDGTAGRGIMQVLGDTADRRAAIAVSDNEVFLLTLCGE